MSCPRARVFKIIDSQTAMFYDVLHVFTTWPHTTEYSAITNNNLRYDSQNIRTCPIKALRYSHDTKKCYIVKASSYATISYNPPHSDTCWIFVQRLHVDFDDGPKIGECGIVLFLEHEFTDKVTLGYLSPPGTVLFEDRKKIKDQLNCEKSDRINCEDRLRNDYTGKDREVKKRFRAGKRKMLLKEMAKKAEEAAEKNEMGTLYKITNFICGKTEAQEKCWCQNERWQAAN